MVDYVVRLQYNTVLEYCILEKPCTRSTVCFLMHDGEECM